MFSFELVLVDQILSRAQWAGVHREGLFTQLQVSSTRVCNSPCLASQCSYGLNHLGDIFIYDQRLWC